MSARAFAVLLAVVAGSGCGVHYVSRGADLYSDGYYIEAAEVFERTEARLEEASPGERARYGLYRGATFLALGDNRGAERWLRYSEAELRREKGALSSDEQNLLRQRLRTLASRRPAPAPLPEGAALATTRALIAPADVDDAATPMVRP